MTWPIPTRRNGRRMKDDSDDCPLDRYTSDKPRAKALNQSAYVGAVKRLALG
jgi:hypothetical protein